MMKRVKKEKRERKRTKKRQRLIAKSTPRCQNDPYDKDEATQHLQDIGLIRSDWNIHQTRCNIDPMYRLLFFGNQRLHMSDGSTPRYIDHLVRNAIDILEKRYGDMFKRARWISHVLPMLCDPDNDDIVPKIFAFMCMLHKIPTLTTTMYELYDSDHPYDMFAAGGNNHFFAFLKYIEQCLEKHFNHANNKYGIARELKGFVQHARQEYMMGPYSH